jgi:hypothetical protein
VRVATPLVSSFVFDKWFSLPNIVLLAVMVAFSAYSSY